MNNDPFTPPVVFPVQNWRYSGTLVLLKISAILTHKNWSASHSSPCSAPAGHWHRGQHPPIVPSECPFCTFPFQHSSHRSHATMFLWYITRGILLFLWQLQVHIASNIKSSVSAGTFWKHSFYLFIFIMSLGFWVFFGKTEIVLTCPYRNGR